MVCTPRSEAAVTISTDAPSGIGSAKSFSAPSTTATTASAASRGPMADARSAPLDPSASSRREPSGSDTVNTDIASEATAAPDPERPQPDWVASWIVVLKGDA